MRGQINLTINYSCKKSKWTYIFLALFFGWFGAQFFYVKQTMLGTLCLLFFWTCVPLVVGWVMAFITLFRKPDKDGKLYFI